MKSISSIGKNPNIQALCIGKFDGIHLGHQAIFSALCSQISSLEEGLALVICKVPSAPSLTPFEEGLCHLCFLRLQLQEISSMSGKEFLSWLKTTYPNLQKIIIGEDFRFGKNRSCGIEELRGVFEVVVVDEVKLEGEGVHTQAILSYLQEGNIPKANAMLGRAYHIKGRVKRGQGIGKKELVPTINLVAPLYILPQSGVYITCTKLRGECYESVSFLGHRLSTDGEFCIESHLFGFGDEVEEDEEVEIVFFQKIRDNQKFSSLSALQEQIHQDIALAREYHSARETIALATSKLR